MSLDIATASAVSEFQYHSVQADKTCEAPYKFCAITYLKCVILLIDLYLKFASVQIRKCTLNYFV